MAEKDKVPVVAIRQIVKMRSNEYHNYSYRAIAEHLNSEFGIEVTPQAIGYLYRKNKDRFSNQMIANSENKSKPLSEKKGIEMTQKAIFKHKEIKKDTLQHFDKNTDNIDLEDLFKPAE